MVFSWWMMVQCHNRQAVPSTKTDASWWTPWAKSNITKTKKKKENHLGLNVQSGQKESKNKVIHSSESNGQAVSWVRTVEVEIVGTLWLFSSAATAQMEASNVRMANDSRPCCLRCWPISTPSHLHLHAPEMPKSPLIQQSLQTQQKSILENFKRQEVDWDPGRDSKSAQKLGSASA